MLYAYVVRPCLWTFGLGAVWHLLNRWLGRYIGRQMLLPTSLIGGSVCEGYMQDINMPGAEQAVEIVFGEEKKRPKRCRVLDVGCGGGVSFRPVFDRLGSSVELHGLDLSQHMVQLCNDGFKTEVKEGRLVLHHGSCIKLPFADGYFDTILLLNMLHIFQNDNDVVLKECARCLRPGGELVIVIQVGAEYTRILPIQTALQQRLIKPVTENQVVELLEQQGCFVHHQVHSSGRNRIIVVRTPK
uniref:Methyltransferase type 11 domain-containing protein n=1 Tax=Mucochytrium quahogii TaxID=96639 RepID=A0A7S2SJD3_9STRA|mmetsp:Transcript_2561/g.3667  ORF Transcript_2561/g.3667 Transcript_2561/m.3667 type:complete len:243 (-) Transcript_2561:3530-4258(-)